MATVEKERKSMISFPSMDERTAVLEEVELLEAIYINELTVVPDDEYVQIVRSPKVINDLIRKKPRGKPTCVKILLHPATGEDVDQQYVCLKLEFIIPSDYPMTIPDIIMKNPRGLADDHVISLRKALHQLATEREGGQMLYELIELAKESLTQCNVPHGNCIICLEDFLNNDTFIKTECYHYFHHHCLMRYIKHSLAELEAEREEATKQKHMEFEVKKVVCPVCREHINYELDNLASTTESVDDGLNVHLSDEIKEMQQKMSELFEKQKAKGGIIDVEAEKNKYYLSLNSASAPAESGSSSVDVGATSEHEDQEPTRASDAPASDTQMASGSLERKEHRTRRFPIDQNKKDVERRDKRNRKTGFQPAKKEERKYREELPKERKKPEAADRRTPIEIDAEDETNIVSVNPDERETSEVSMKAVNCGPTESENRRVNSGRGRGRGYRSNWGKNEYRRYDDQSKYKRRNDYKRRDEDSESVEQRRDHNDWGHYKYMTQCRRTSDRRPKKQENEGKDRERSEIFKLDKEIAERKSEESFSNGHMELVDTGKMHSVMLTSEQCIDSTQKGPSTAKSDRFKNEGKRAPPGFKTRGSYSEYRGGKQRSTRSKYEDFR